MDAPPSGRPPLLPEYAPPGLSPADLWMERSNLIGLVIAAAAWGVLFTIFVQCIVQLRKTGSSRERHSWALMAYSCLLFTFATLGFVGNTRFIQMTYIDYRNYPGGPNAFGFEQYTLPINMLGLVCYVMMNWFADGLMLYRFMVIYQYKFVLLVLPALIYLGIVALSITMMVFTMTPSIGFWAPISIKAGIAYWSLSIVLNLLITSSIAGRLLKMRSAIRAVLGPKHSSPYTSVLSMIVESAALYTAWALIFMASYAKGDTFQNVVLPALGQVQAIAPLLIIFRVAQGKAWTADTGASGTSGVGTSTTMDFNVRQGQKLTFNSNNTRGATESFQLSSITGSTVDLDRDPEKSSQKDIDL
ncbi:hypothetical protein D9611_002007 [Ephemerocybe angulata]|uniref:Uncharacterized protein n=1 Tax=Ephemerocybe angulata TaxID=980116 RepID=A0A8H5FN75_9AGAR|nr:hypothetical protein D9611_002007 [Tulosesus angulatus]